MFQYKYQIAQKLGIHRQTMTRLVLKHLIYEKIGLKKEEYIKKRQFSSKYANILFNELSNIK